jgi:hypothetical protein
MQHLMQCLHCAWRLFFKPLSDETFTACMAYKETAGQINLRTGVSPAIKRHGMGSEFCRKFKTGRSPCEDSKYQVRNLGEALLLRKLTPKKS